MSAYSLFQQDFSAIHVPAQLVYPATQQLVEAGHQLLIAAESHPLHHLSLDFVDTTTVDSSGIGALKHLAQIAKGHGIQLACLQVQPQLRLALADLVPDLEFLVESPAAPPLYSTRINQTLLLSESPAIPQLIPHASVASRGKRLLDIAGALVGLGITGVILVPLAILIKLDNPGPIFFVQTRMGCMGRPFRMWKFRSMMVNAEALKGQVANQIDADGKFFKNANDPRITRIGRLLRRTSLDEFPQFLNVLRGDMSLVGTRPPTLDEVEKYSPYEWQRLNVKPGMTGEWQVNGRSSVETFEQVVELDLKYQRRWSLRYDLQLIGKTVMVLLVKHKDAC
jgi:lipopolysaccharide/colanic/teichoic acid biosynthesis glycosyltransferase/anti-anti-sigma regulatory factor